MRAAIPHGMDRIPVRMAPLPPVELPGSYGSPPASPLRSPLASPPNSPPSPVPPAMTCSQRMEAQERQWAEAAARGHCQRQQPRSSEPIAVPWAPDAVDEDSEWRRAVELHLAQLGEAQASGCKLRQ